MCPLVPLNCKDLSFSPNRSVAGVTPPTSAPLILLPLASAALPSIGKCNCNPELSEAGSGELCPSSFGTSNTLICVDAETEQP